ncbi:hypothetical protein CUJ83_15075 [Methanocella sp. CWC-04]|uniref:AB hydrolase-1 domain-containing protein n=1 Tax=Methanooceanicella nereidis TaxID=2052831 RepID=A0AAP2W8M5_9EURY|nr:alpha/beta fold hydrolase [Methanocella sp. CWC-04]MCD1296324.1 hypothetical protein [Methanocella sp. CWC-04]
MDKRAIFTIITVCVLAYIISFYFMLGTFQDIKQEYHHGETPVLLMGPLEKEPLGTVVIAHGFSGNIDMMKSMGASLAQNGYRAILFDLPGHGNSDTGMENDSLYTSFEYVTEHYGGDNFSVAGHSMGSQAAMEYGMMSGSLSCTAISPIFSEVNRTSPKNLLILVGDDDPEHIQKAALNALINGTMQNAEPGMTYGDIDDGTARRLEILPGANHITIIFDTRTYDAMLKWLDSTYNVDREGDYNYNLAYPWFLICSLIALIAYFPISYLLFDHYKQEEYKLKAPAPKAWKPMLTILVSGFIAAILIYLFNPVSLLNIMIADTIIGFLIYTGIIGLIIYTLTGKDKPSGKYPADAILRPLSLAMLMLIYFAVFIGVPASLSVYDLIPDDPRLYLLILIFFLMIPYCMLNELLFRSIDGRMSLATGISARILLVALFTLGALVFGNGSFIMIIMPVMLPLFILLEIFSCYSYRWSGNVLTGAFLNSLIIAWLVVSAFPIGILPI